MQNLTARQLRDHYREQFDEVLAQWDNALYSGTLTEIEILERQVHMANALASLWDEVLENAKRTG